MRLGVDFSWGRPGAAAILRAGFGFVMRYVPYPGDGGKGLTEPEARELLDSGLDVGLVFESTAGRMFDGAPAGLADAQLCAAVSWIPSKGVAIYFACDVDTTPEQLAYVDDYLRGAASVLGVERVGVYGEFDVVQHCIEAGTAKWGWQTYAWSGGRVYERAHVLQYLNGQTLNGASVDFNKALQPDFGQWEAIDMAVLDEIKAVMIGNGIDVEADKGTLDLCPPGTKEGATVRLTGEQAWQYAVRKGWSLGLGLGQLRGRVSALEARPAGGIPEHTHEPGKVSK